MTGIPGFALVSIGVAFGLMLGRSLPAPDTSRDMPTTIVKCPQAFEKEHVKLFVNQRRGVEGGASIAAHREGRSGGGAASQTLMKWWGLPSGVSAQCDAPQRQKRNVIVAFSSFKRSTSNGTMLMLESFKRATSGQGIGGSVSKGGSPHAPAFELVILSNRDPDHERFVALQEVIKKYPGVTVLSIANMMSEVQNDTSWAQSKHFLNMRPLYMLRWMKQNPLKLCPNDRIAVSDEDLVYQGDPFDIFEAIPGYSLYLFGEKTNFTNADALNKLYVEIATGSESTRKHVHAGQVFCFGFAVAEAWAMRELHDRLAVLIYTRGYAASDETKAALDQGGLNVLVHTGALDDLGLRKVYNEEPWVTHLTSQIPNPPIPFETLLKTRRVVHQYKWVNYAKKRFQEEYNLTL
eukprot:m.10056 g.10056  ORF g.10056 m.10056 type:complete len:406 (-) comp2707_c0_seq1:253-1470(-)